MNIVNKKSVWNAPAIFILSALSYGWSLPAKASDVPTYDNANCPFTNGWGSRVFNVTLPKITNSESTAVGAIIFQNTQYYPTGPYLQKCDRSSAIYTSMFTYVNSEGIAPTSVPGVGVRIMSTTSGQWGAQFDSPGTNKWWRGSQWPHPPYVFTSGDGFRFELIKTGTISPGNFRTGVYGNIDEARHTVALVKRAVATINVTGGSVSTPTCTVTNKSINVPMGDIKRSEFSAIGSTAANKTFNIFLNCEVSTNIKMTLTATSDSSKAPGVIALNSAGGGTVADGVGIQLLNNNKPVTLGAPFTVGTALSESTRVEMVARYYQTKSTVIAGKANGTATFTFTYN